MKAERRPSRSFLLGSVILYLASLTQIGFCLLTGGAERCDNYGIFVVGFGWMETLFIGDVGPFVAHARGQARTRLRLRRLSALLRCR